MQLTDYVDLYKEDVQWDIFYLLGSSFLKWCVNILNGGLIVENLPKMTQTWGNNAFVQPGYAHDIRCFCFCHQLEK